jgi:hypothetical protein
LPHLTKNGQNFLSDHSMTKTFTKFLLILLQRDLSALGATPASDLSDMAIVAEELDGTSKQSSSTKKSTSMKTSTSKASTSKTTSKTSTKKTSSKLPKSTSTAVNEALGGIAPGVKPGSPALSDAPVANLNSPKSTKAPQATSNLVQPSPTAVGYPIDDAIGPDQEADTVAVDDQEIVDEPEIEDEPVQEDDQDVVYDEGSSTELDASDPTIEGVPVIAGADPTKSFAINAVTKTPKPSSKSLAKSTMAVKTSTRGSSFTKVVAPSIALEPAQSSSKRLAAGLFLVWILL